MYQGKDHEQYASQGAGTGSVVGAAVGAIKTAAAAGAAEAAAGGAAVSSVANIVSGVAANVGYTALTGTEALAYITLLTSASPLIPFIAGGLLIGIFGGYAYGYEISRVEYHELSSLNVIGEDEVWQSYSNIE